MSDLERNEGGLARPDPQNNSQTQNPASDVSPDWERDLLNRLAFASVNEQRRARRWGIFFKSLTFLYLLMFFLVMPGDWKSPDSSKEHTALVQVEGVIGPDSEASADIIIGGLRAAFKNKNSKAVILRINSPGGSPVQSGYVYDEIKRLRKKYQDKKLYAVITDMCASGGYYIAAAADEIYADKASLVGSIGVLINSFGFVDAMKKLGVERRMYTAGKNKGILDPFSPVKPSDRKHIDKMLQGIHQQFIQSVKDGRGDKLKQSPELFSGLFWNGDEGVKLGLVDALGSSSYVAREVVGAEKIVNYTPRSDFLERFADRLGASFAKMMVQLVGTGAQSADLF
ncbi:MAG: S49 family peptidase [Gammaproteobacteria bacterium]|nr:S49 family peptidase [Gammaproteobacteria bacterium]MDH5802415.1 S49 family peptidase [Gammaproteobacteria bacterium]